MQNDADFRTNTSEYAYDLAFMFEQTAINGQDGPGCGPTDSKIIAMGLRLLAAQLPSQAALARAEILATALKQG